IPAGLASQTFFITPIHDGLVTGTQSVLIEAQADPSTGIIAGMETLKIDDVDRPSVKVSVAATQLDEGQSAEATGSINPVVGFDVSVTLSASLPYQLDMPVAVTIPAGASSFTFTIAALDDEISRAFHNVTVTATAVGFGQDRQTIGVSDSDVPPLVVTIEPTA